MFDIFETLLSKTFFILAISLSFCYFGTQAVLSYFRKLKNNGSPDVTAVYNEHGQEDLIVNPELIMKPFWISFAAFILSFIILLVCKNISVINVLAMLVFTFSSGVTIGIRLITQDENIGVQVTQLTGLAVLLTAVIGTLPGVDFSFLGGFLFISLICFLIASIVRIFIRISGTARKIFASIGVALFCAYLLFDFNRLAKFNEIEVTNTWSTALNFALEIYLDIINLFIQILNLLSNNN